MAHFLKRSLIKKVKRINSRDRPFCFCRQRLDDREQVPHHGCALSQIFEARNTADAQALRLRLHHGQA